MNAHLTRQRHAQTTFRSTALPRRQRGVVAVLTAIAMLVLVGFTAMSLDSGHMILNNTRLQDVVDAATLNAAQTLDETGSTALADAAVIATLNANAADIGYQEIDAALQGGITPVIDYSNTLVPFTSGSNPPQFVRVTVSSLPLQPWFMQVFGLAKAVTVSAVSGPTLRDPCDVLPLLACGENDPPPGGDFGYDEGEIHVLKIAAGNTHGVGNGNFQLLDFAEGSGGKSIRINTAGGFECGDVSVDDGAETKPGNTVGPLVDGIDSRFIDDSHNHVPTPPFFADFEVGVPAFELGFEDINGDGFDQSYQDLNGNNQGDPGEEVSDTSGLSYNHTSYLLDYAGPPAHDSNSPRYERRVVTVPVGECAGNVNGTGHVDLYGFACFFLLQRPIQHGGAAQIYGEFIDPEEYCGIPDPGNKTTKIVLYKDPDKVDS